MNVVSYKKRLGHKILLPVRILIAATVVAAGRVAYSENASPRILEYRIKSGFLFNFAKYVNWPQGTFGSPTNAITIGILGKDPFGEVLDNTVSAKSIDGRPIVLRRFRDAENIKECHVLFVSASEQDRLAAISEYLKRRAVLTVGDFQGFLQAGGQIEFVAEKDQVKFDVNLVAVRSAGLKLDANLLRVAHRVLSEESKQKAGAE